MTPHDEAVLPDMADSGFVIKEDVMSAVKADSAIFENFQKLPPLYVRVRIDNIQSYPQDSETYALRLDKFLQNTKIGKLYGDWNDGGRLL